MAAPPCALFLLLPFLAAAAAASSGELTALLALKSSLDPTGAVLSSWTSSSSGPCGGGFLGVACDSDGHVTNISLPARGLPGSISPAVAGLQWLTGLYLHYNRITGELPREIGRLEMLVDLYLDVNEIGGSVPEELAGLKNLRVLQLGYNQLTGSIPSQLGQLKSLTVLALQSNQLVGAIPATLGDLPELTRIDLSSNQLFGSIPALLADCPLLAVLDLRNNSLSGSVPSGLKRLDGGFQYANNRGLCGAGFDMLELCPASEDGVDPSKPEPFGPDSANLNARQVAQSSGSSPDKKSGSNSAGIVIGSVVGVGIGVAICGMVAFSCYRRQKQKIGSSVEAADSRLSTDHQPKEVSRRSASPLINVEYSTGWDPVSSATPNPVTESFRFNLEEVECATQYFSPANLIGRSSFAATYKGILRDRSLVAVKSIGKSSCKQEEAEFLNGLKEMVQLRHENLVRLRGFCCSRARGECFLVYDFMASGCLTQFLDVGGGGRVLDWHTRVSIIKGIAHGIEYLHSKRAGGKAAVVHQNISAETVLLDSHFAPRLSGAGLHKLLADDVVFSALKASAAMGYLAPEYAATGRFTEKSDVYAFGIVVLQIITGKKAVSHLRHGADLEAFVDEKLNGEFPGPEAAMLLQIAFSCAAESPAQRPAMESVVQQLAGGC